MNSKEKPFRVDLHGGIINKGDKLVCPICGKEFKVDDDTCYVCNGGYTCSWKCFLINNSKVQEKRKAEEELIKLNNLSEKSNKYTRRIKDNA